MSQVRIQNKSLLVKYQTLRDKLNHELTYTCRDQEIIPFNKCYETIFLDFMQTLTLCMALTVQVGRQFDMLVFMFYLKQS